jgi:peptidyl-prolyl cis-trans isomerase B (cyclophilin B)
MKKFVCAMLCILLVLSAGCAISNESGQPSDEVEPKTNGSALQSDEAEPQSYETVHVTIDVKDYGTISVELDGANAPITVSNFISLVKDGFYDGLTFHRIISGFMIQGGDPEGTGTGGSDKTIKGEFSLNGVENPLSHTRGAISMARSDDYDSASSQFFIVHEDSTGLDGQYAVFGYVTEGMDIVDRICADTPVVDNNGTVEKENQPIITSIKVID